MKLQSFLLLGAFVVNAVAIPVTFFSFYYTGRSAELSTSRGATVRDHQAQWIINNIAHWSNGQFTAYRSGSTLVVKTVQPAGDRAEAQRVVGEMYNLVISRARN